MKRPKPTEAELEILAVIWDGGPMTVRNVHDVLAERRDIGHTTVLKLMQIMTEKGILERDADVRPQMFRAARPRQHTQKQLLVDLLDRAFAGSPGSLVMQALSAKRTTPEDRDRIRAMLEDLERRADS